MQISDFFPLYVFMRIKTLPFLFLFAYMLTCVCVCVKSFCNKKNNNKEFKTALMTTFILLLPRIFKSARNVFLERNFV